MTFIENTYKSSLMVKLFELATEVKPVANARVVSAVVRKGVVVGLGVNTYKTHPRAKELHDGNSKECLHAEMNAIFQAQRTYDEDLSDCDIYVVRAKFGGVGGGTANPWTPGKSKPCIACQKLINAVRIKTVYCTL